MVAGGTNAHTFNEYSEWLFIPYIGVDADRNPIHQQHVLGTYMHPITPRSTPDHAVPFCMHHQSFLLTGQF